MKINDCRGDLTDISAKKEPLLQIYNPDPAAKVPTVHPTTCKCNAGAPEAASPRVAAEGV